MKNLAAPVGSLSRLTLYVALAALLGACGGGGDSGLIGRESAAESESAAPVTLASPGAVPGIDAIDAEAVNDTAKTPTHPTRYAYTDLGTLGGTRSAAGAINNAGQIVGSSALAGDAATHATLWSGGTVTDLGTLGGADSGANDINNAGQIVGTSYLAGDAATRATLWSGGTVTDLGTVDGKASFAAAINDAGQIVGSYFIDGIEGGRALLWDGTTMTELAAVSNGGGLIGGAAIDINNAGLVVGASATRFSDNRAATMWIKTTPTLLGGNADSVAFGVNDRGQIVGVSGSNPVFLGQATSWNGTTPTLLTGLVADELGRYPGAGLGINNAGQIVGRSAATNFANSCCDWHAVLWKGTTPTDLNTLLDASTAGAGWVLVSATDINDKGWIVGMARKSPTGEEHAYLLTPLTDKEQCKKGGWHNFGFPNQGQCIQFVNTGK